MNRWATLFVITAILLVGVLGLGHAAGLRELTSVISGTPPPEGISFADAIVFGSGYALAWFLGTTVAPILGLAAMAHIVLVRLTARRPRPQHLGSATAVGCRRSH